MLISALNDYYEILEASGKAIPKGYSEVAIHYLVHLNDCGEITDISLAKIPDATSASRKARIEPLMTIFPQRTEKSAIESNFIEHRPVYLFGLNASKEEFTHQDKTNKAINSHTAFCEYTLKNIEGIDEPLVNAYRAFIQNFDPAIQKDNPYLNKVIKTYKTAGFNFCLEGAEETLLTDLPCLKERWEEICTRQANEEKLEGSPGCAVCAISGKVASVARIHPKIKGFNAMGSVLVNYNNEAEESYGKKQAYNSSVSEEVAENYTSALNYLLRDRKHCQSIEDMRLVYFAMDISDAYIEKINESLFDFMGSHEDKTSMTKAETDIKLDAVMSDASRGCYDKGAEALPEMLDDNTVFYMFGLKPNSSRLAQKFVYRSSFGQLMKNIQQHQKDLKLDEGYKDITLYSLLHALKPNANKKIEVDPALSEKILYSIMNGTDYPAGIFYQAIQRIKTDRNTERYKKLTPTRVGIIKACLNRGNRLKGKKEEIKMGLDEENKSVGYLLGRLFSLLEKAQKEASPGLNRTIMDSYYGSACSTPAIIFPKLIKLSNHHLAKAEYGYAIKNDIGKVLALIDGSFPERLSLAQQGEFAIGYYHQTYQRNKSVKQEQINNNEMEN